MRKSDKLKKLKQVNLIIENNYLKSKGFVNENGPTIDIDGISDYFANQIKEKGEDYIGFKDQITKTANGDESIIRSIYSAIGEKLKGGASDSIGQAYSSSMLGVSESEDNSEEVSENIVNTLLSQNDGPVDEFVVISRGVEMAAAGNNPEIISNAIYDALNRIKGHGELPSNEMPRIGV